MSKPYQDMDDRERSQFWADSAEGGFLGGAQRYVMRYIQRKVRTAYLRGLEDGRRLERGEPLEI